MPRFKRILSRCYRWSEIGPARTIVAPPPAPPPFAAIAPARWPQKTQKTQREKCQPDGSPLLPFCVFCVFLRPFLPLQLLEERDQVFLLLGGQARFQDDVEELDHVLQRRQPAVVE